MADKTKADLEAENGELKTKLEELEAQVEELTKPGSAPEPRKIIALRSLTGKTRNRGGYAVPFDSTLVLALDSVDPRDLKALEADPHIMKLRTDAPITESPERFDNAAEREHYAE